MYGGRCAYCGEEIAFEDFHIDHVVPKARGGKDHLNTFPACRDCNIFKCDNDLEGFRERLENLPYKNINTRLLAKYSGVKKHPIKFYFERAKDGDL